MGISSVGRIAWPFNRFVEDNRGCDELEIGMDAEPFAWPFDTASTSL